MEPAKEQAERLKNFAERTWANLIFIEQHVPEDSASSDVYEVTQLMNSLLLLVVAADEWLYVDDGVSLEALTDDGLPVLLFTGERPPKDLKGLTHFLRNAISHVNVDFASESGRITAVALWNHRNGKLTEPHTADLVVSIDNLRLLAEFLPRRYGLLEPATGTLRIRADRL